MRLRFSLLAIPLAWILLFPESPCAETIPVRHKEGVSHGFLVLRTLEGEAIATGDLIQGGIGRNRGHEAAAHNRALGGKLRRLHRKKGISGTMPTSRDQFEAFVGS